MAQTYDYEVEKVPLTADLSGFSGVCMMVDRDGFMWFGSRDGLYRYDGSKFKIFRYAPGNTNTISNDRVNHIIEDKDGIIWIATHWGLNSYNKCTGEFKYYSDAQIRDNIIEHLLEDEEGILWLSTRNGLVRFDKTSAAYHSYLIQPVDTLDIPDLNRVFRTYEDKAGNLWIQNGHNGLSRYDRQTDSIEVITAFPCGLKSILEDRSGRFWITTQCGLYLFDRGTSSFLKYLDEPGDPNCLRHPVVRAMLEDRVSNLWIRTYDGIYGLNRDLKLIFRWEHEEYKLSTPDFSLTNYLCEDKSGTIWFFTKDGIHKVIRKHRNFTILDPHPELNTYVDCMCRDNEYDLWFGTTDGIYNYSKKNNQYTHYKLSKTEYLNKAVNPDGVKAIYLDIHGMLWIAPLRGGLYSMNLANHQMNMVDINRTEFSDESDSNGNPIMNFFEDSEGNVWMPREQSLPLIYVRDQDRIICLVDNPDTPDRLRPFHQFHETTPGVLIVAGGSAVYEIRKPLSMVSDYTAMPTFVDKMNKHCDKPELLESINCSYFDNQGIIWLGTVRQGLIKMVERGKPGSDLPKFELHAYTSMNGLPSNCIHSISGDENGNIWIGTFNGLSRFDKNSKTVTNYYLQDGLPSNGFQFRSVFKDSDGQLFFGTEKGIVSFNPDSIVYNSFIPPVFLTDLKINNKTLSPSDSTVLSVQVAYAEAIDLNYDQNNISLEFAVLNYIESYKNQYMYMLEGFDNQWIHSGNKNSVDYTNLDPGQYHFKVIASNNDGVWNHEGASLSIHIHSPPWLTWWAYGIYACILVGMIFLYRRYLKKRAELRAAIEVERIDKEKMQELDSMKSRFFANISHEFRTPLTLILGPVENALKRKDPSVIMRREELGVVRRNARRLQQLINQLLDLSRMETGKVRLQVSEGDLTEFTRRIVLSFLSQAESKHIAYTYELPDCPGGTWFDGDKLEKIATNLISNAFKFTPEGGEVGLKMRYLPMEERQDQDHAVPGIIEFTVRDTGKGIPPDQIGKIFDRFYQVSSSDTRQHEGTGIGLSLTKELVEIYRGEIRVESKPGAGSLFIVRLPISRTKFNDDEIAPQDTEQPDKLVDQTLRSDDLPEEPTEEVAVEYKEPATRTSEIGGNRPQILVVEDVADLRNYISGNLVPEYRIIEARNGIEGLEKTRAEIPDLVISDVMMPEMDGMELCTRLKGDECTSHIPVIILTAKSTSQDKMEGLKCGADDYIFKPFKIEELKVRISNLLEQRERLRKKYSAMIGLDWEELKVTTLDEQFLKKATCVISENLHVFEFDVGALQERMAMSREHLYRKLKALTGESPSSLIRIMRLKAAVNLMERGEETITELAMSSGFSSSSYFTRCFKEYYGKSPRDYRNEMN